MSDIDKLIGRLEAASEGSRELDGLVARAVDDSIIELSSDHPGTAWRRGARGDCDYWSFEVAEFSTSIEAALTLVPEWASVELTKSAAGPPTFTRCRLWDWRRSSTMSDPGNEWKAEGNRPLAINICIAALKARKAAAT